MTVLVVRTEEDDLGLGLGDTVGGEALLEVVDVEIKVKVEVERGSVEMTLSCKGAEVLADATWLLPVRAATSALIPDTSMIPDRRSPASLLILKAQP